MNTSQFTSISWRIKRGSQYLLTPILTTTGHLSWTTNRDGAYVYRDEQLAITTTRLINEFLPGNTHAEVVPFLHGGN